MIIKTPEQHLQEIRNKAIIRGGKLITEKWINYKYQYEFIFKDGRKFF